MTLAYGSNPYEDMARLRKAERLAIELDAASDKLGVRMTGDLVRCLHDEVWEALENAAGCRAASDITKEVVAEMFDDREGNLPDNVIPLVRTA